MLIIQATHTHRTISSKKPSAQEFEVDVKSSVPQLYRLVKNLNHPPTQLITTQTWFRISSFNIIMYFVYTIPYPHISPYHRCSGFAPNMSSGNRALHNEKIFLKIVYKQLCCVCFHSLMLQPTTKLEVTFFEIPRFNWLKAVHDFLNLRLLNLH